MFKHHKMGIFFQEQISTLCVLIWGLFFCRPLCCKDFWHLLMSFHLHSLVTRSGVASVPLHSFLSFLLVCKFQLADAFSNLTINDFCV